MVNLSKLRKELHDKVNHTTALDRHVFTYEEVGSGYYGLEWRYGKHGVYARSQDDKLIHLLKDCIKMYLEETEKKEE